MSAQYVGPVGVVAFAPPYNSATFFEEVEHPLITLLKVPGLVSSIVIIVLCDDKAQKTENIHEEPVDEEPPPRLVTETSKRVDEAFRRKDEYRVEVYNLPPHFTEEGALAHMKQYARGNETDRLVLTFPRGTGVPTVPQVRKAIESLVCEASRTEHA